MNIYKELLETAQNNYQQLLENQDRYHTNLLWLVALIVIIIIGFNFAIYIQGMKAILTNKIDTLFKKEKEEMLKYKNSLKSELEESIKIQYFFNGTLKLKEADDFIKNKKYASALICLHSAFQFLVRTDEMNFVNDTLNKMITVLSSHDWIEKSEFIFKHQDYTLYKDVIDDLLSDLSKYKDNEKYSKNIDEIIKILKDTLQKFNTSPAG